MSWELVTSSGRVYPIHDGAVLGRSSRVDIAIDAPTASREHAQFRVRGDEVVLQDLNSTNGTFVNRAQIRTPIALREGDQIRVGDLTLSLRQVPDAPADRESAAPARGYPPAERINRQQDRPRPPAPALPDRPAPAWARGVEPPSCPSCGSSGTVQSTSAAGLAMPKPPSDTPLKIVRIFFWIYVAFAGLMMLLLLGTFLLGGAVSVLDQTGISAGLLGISGVASLCFLVPALAVIILVPWLIKRYIERRYRERYEQWQRAKSKWDRLYYCAQCAGVFLPGQRRLIPIEQMESFLFEISPKAIDF